MPRTRYRWDVESKSLVEVGSDWNDTPRRAQTVTEELVHGKSVTLEGVDISSRKKRREYMKREGVTDTSDFKNEWAKAKERRDAVSEGRHDIPKVREQVARVAYQLEQKQRRK